LTSFFSFSIETEHLAEVAREDCLLVQSGDVHDIDVISQPFFVPIAVKLHRVIGYFKYSYAAYLIFSSSQITTDDYQMYTFWACPVKSRRSQWSEFVTYSLPGCAIFKNLRFEKQTKALHLFRLLPRDMSQRRVKVGKQGSALAWGSC
jgi:hypothetical protein